MPNQIEAIIASPPERDELIVQLFVKNGSQWGEIYRDSGKYWIDIFQGQGRPTARFQADEFMTKIYSCLSVLRERLEENS